MAVLLVMMKIKTAEEYFEGKISHDEYYGLFETRKDCPKGGSLKQPITFNFLKKIRTDAQKEIIEAVLPVIEFYADENNWRKQNQVNYNICHLDDVEEFTHYLKVGGRRAREAKQQLKKIIGGSVT